MEQTNKRRGDWFTHTFLGQKGTTVSSHLLLLYIVDQSIILSTLDWKCDPPHQEEGGGGGGGGGGGYL
jgi:hypothetical protein